MFCVCSVFRRQFPPHTFFLIVLTVLITLCKFDGVVSSMNGIIHFCYNDIGYTVSTEVCPGGIRFLSQAFRPDNDCVCSEGIFLAPGAKYGVDSSMSTPVFVQPDLECRLWKQGYSYDSSQGLSSSEEGCRKEPWKALQVTTFLLELKRWFVIPLADASNLDRESLAMWRGVDDESMYDLEDFRLFRMDSSGRIRVPLENDFQGYFTYYKGVGNVSNQFHANEIQIGQYCRSIAGNDKNKFSLLYMNQRSLRFDNTSIKYGCSRNSIKMIVTEFGNDTEPKCQASCFRMPFSVVMRYEDLLYQNNRPLAPQENIIQHFKNALKTDFSDILELRLNNFRNSKKYLRHYESSPTCLEVLSKAIAIVQKLLNKDKEKKLIENIVKVFVIGTGGNLGIQSLESECKELVQLFDSCMENLVPIAMEEENCTKNSTTNIENMDENENEKYLKNDLVVEVIKTSLNLATAQCLVTLETKYRNVFQRKFAQVVNKIYRSPLFHEKFWFLETEHIMVLLPGLSTGFLRQLEELGSQVNTKFKHREVFSSKLKWRRAEKLYQLKKRVMKPWTNEMRICDGFTIWGLAACCLQLDSRHNLVPNMNKFKKVLKNGPGLCA